ncbi:hypothetical protein DD236_08055 [Ancrocorticia populi]|uniref:Uncharacterized protein n=1 Tax=Ancrocorticia populi TaxID=2175228 RepID=A0A2V1K8M0_9ACTO|nr:hypothetical protein DD236_08055 [Ancrocorticia populi]
MPHYRGETVTLHIRVDTGRKTSSNDPIYRNEDVDRPNCMVAPRVKPEAFDYNSVTYVHGFDVYDTYDCPITASDKVTIRGVKYNVDGEISRWANPYDGQKKGCHYAVKTAGYN